jgi:uncharacterized repeat protein (TIGR03943 family)
MRRIYYYTLILLFAVYVGILFYSGRLDFYVHPRYAGFGYAMAVAAGTFACFGIVRAVERRLHQDQHYNLKPSEVASSLLLVVTLAVGLAFPPRPLSNYTAGQREVDFNSLRAADRSTADLFIQNTSVYTLGDWVSSINANPDLSQYIDKRVDVTGFVYDRIGVVDQFTVARFVVTCCAVDARPVGLAVERADWQAEFAENSWVRVQGTFKLIGEGETQQLVVIPNTIEAISEPDDPYIY